MKTEVVLRAFAQRRPDHEAVVCGDERLTYRMLEERTNQVAHSLAAQGIVPGDRVALVLSNGIPWLELALGTIKCGALVVPISTRLTAAEVDWIVGNCTPRYVFRDADAAAFLATARAAASAPPPVPPPLPDDCLIGYTSGTEDKPKGVITTHANLLLTAYVNNADYGLRGDDRLLVTTPFAHRTAQARVWNAFTLGATLVVMPKFDPAETLATIARERITVTGLVPTVARMLLDAFGSDTGAYASLRMMISVGEPFPVSLKQQLFARLPHIELYSALGMTEGFGAAVLLSGDQVAHAGAAGRPTPGVEVRLLDDDGNEVPTGETGEILVRSGAPGQWLGMRGYWDDPEKTAQTMRDGWIATGDMGRFDADGFLYVVDRKKDMVLTGGLNVSSLEVEGALLAHPAVQAAGVVGTADPTFGEAVVAFVELRPGMTATAEEIVEHCRSRIASYKKPKYVFFEPLPRNAVGKVLKRELRTRVAELLPS
jgi:acyl-CoA synthetase (AMP-forming)/AMP-acid ligase II